MLIEAVALGVPIAAMDTGGTRDIIQRGRHRAALDRSATASRAISRGSRPTSGCAARSARRRAPTCTSRFAAASVVERVEQVYRGAAAAARRVTADRAPLRVAVVARAVDAAARRRRPRAIGPRPRAASGGARRPRHARSRRRPSADASPRPSIRSPRRAFTLRHVPYLTFPFANRRGTTILDRSTAYLAVRPARRPAGAATCSRRRRGRHRARIWRERARLRASARARPRRSSSIRRGSRNSAPPARVSRSAKRVGYAPLRRAVRRCARAADAIIATDASLETDGRSGTSQPRPGQMRTIPNGIDLVDADRAGRARPRAAILRQRHGIGAGEIVLLSVGRLEAEQRIRRARRRARPRAASPAGRSPRDRLALGHRRRRPVPARPSSARSASAGSART